MGAIIYGIERRKGFVAIYGEVGVGKTTIIRAYLEKTSDRKQKTVYILNPVLSFHGLLTDIFRSLDLVPSQDDSAEMVNQLQEALIQEYRSDSTVVLVIDEAQNMPVKTLEQLRLLSNLETSTDKLIQIVLIGQPELTTLLNHPTLKSLNQRIALRATIQPLQPKESQAYIEHRIALSSSTGTPLFTQGAMKLIIREAQGIPRRINILCDNALITGYGRQQKPVSVSEVREILADMEGSRSSYLVKWAVGVAVVILLAIGAFLLSPIFLPGNVGVSQIGLSERDSQNARATSSEKMSQENIGQLEEQSIPMASSVSQIERPISHADEGRVDSGMTKKSVEKVIGTSKSDGTLRDHREVPSKPSQGSSITRSVKEGDNLSQIANEAYGSSSRQYVEWLRRHNPQISDPDIILPGQKIVLPEYVKE
ncbi:AAA family ATPase [Candidatus Nitrospira neomarina]|uniref:AAA family ATPase n=1 Tax=Candidatus Nitrospira neomarina TaxID=3020899 RepID=A0AA96GHA8_9BACT|nr:AAA family ATPase [Candidatus Nitrospira neomarina]WNM60265.1 AAA family ATPase [Candidatus Nitrospira neomarina]